MKKLFIIFLGLISLITLTTRAATEAEIAALKTNTPLLSAFRWQCALNEDASIGTVIDTIKTMTIIILDNKRISSFTGMPELPNLEWFTLSRNPISSFKDMPELSNLTKLKLTGSNISNFNHMPILLELKELDLSGTKISNFNDMPNLPELEKLNLSETQISSLNGMPEMPKLTTLYFYGSLISNLEGMPNLPSLTELYLINSKLYNFIGMPELPSLRIINLTDSQLSSLEGIQNLSNFKIIYKNTPLATKDRLIIPCHRYLNYDFSETAFDDDSAISNLEQEFGKLFDGSWYEPSFVQARNCCLDSVYAYHRMLQIKSYYSDSPKSHFLNLNFALYDPHRAWFVAPNLETIEDSKWDGNWETENHSVKGQLREIIDKLFKDDKRLSELKGNILEPQTSTSNIVPPFFDRLLLTAEGQLDPDGMKQRMIGIVNHLINYRDKEKEHCKNLLRQISEGNATCIDRLSLALTSIENDIAFFRSKTEAEKLSIAINAYKLKKIEVVLTTWIFDSYDSNDGLEIDSNDALEDVLYHTLLLRDALGIMTKTASMAYSDFSTGKKSFPYALDQIFQHLNVEDLLNFMKNWQPLQLYYSSHCMRTVNSYELFDDAHSYTDPDYETYLDDFIKQCALEGLVHEGYIVKNPFYEVLSYQQEI